MPAPTTSTDPDWTTGPAKWAAVLILGAATITGLAWSILARQPHPRLWAPAAGAVPAAASAGEPFTASSLTPAPAPEAEPAAPAPTTSTSPTRLININSASEAELELLPGIGPTMARRIAEDRAKRGAFKTIDSLDRVRGIGPETIRKLRSLVTVE